MNYLVLGSKIEYEQAAQRLEELVDAKPGTLEAQERKELIHLFVQFEKHIKDGNQTEGSTNETAVKS